MKSLDGILSIVDAEMESIAKNGKFHTRDEIDMVYKLIDIAKDVYCIWAYEDGDEEMSYADEPYMRGGRGVSYAGRRNARRDSMGRYSRNSRIGGYSRADGKEEYISHLRDMMEDAPDDATRQHMKRMIEQIERT